MSERIILFGGTFDPVHIGHMAVALAAAAKIGSTTAVLIPARRSPHKQSRPLAADNDRIAMLKLASGSERLFHVSPVELNRAEPSYTIDTIRHFKQKFGGNCQLYWLIGADMLKDLPKWHRVDELMRECTICVMYRGGFGRPNMDGLTAKLGREAVEKLQQNIIETPLVDISSTHIREKIADGQDVGKFLHPDVLEYIKQHRLYMPVD